MSEQEVYEEEEYGTDALPTDDTGAMPSEESPAEDATNPSTEDATADGVAAGADDDAELQSLLDDVNASEDWQNELKKIEQVSTTDVTNANEEGNDSDLRSIYVGNVDYSVTTQDLEQYFTTNCGPVVRVTIPVVYATQQPRGFAYVEFKDAESVVQAILLNENEFKGRPLKITNKRVNVPHSKIPRGGAAARGGTPRGGRGTPRGRGRGRGGFGMMPMAMGYPGMPPGMMMVPMPMPMGRMMGAMGGAYPPRGGAAGAPGANPGRGGYAGRGNPRGGPANRYQPY